MNKANKKIITKRKYMYRIYMKAERDKDRDRKWIVRGEALAKLMITKWQKKRVFRLDMVIGQVKQIHIKHTNTHQNHADFFYVQHVIA